MVLPLGLVKEIICMEGSNWAQMALRELSVIIPSWFSLPCFLAALGHTSVCRALSH